MFLFTVLFGTTLANFGAGMYGANPYMQQSPFKTLPNANNPSVMMIFGDGVDAKDAQEFIAAGMLPRYLPLLTDGVDNGDAWLYGLGPASMMGGAPTEASVIQRAQMADPAAAALGHPSNLELMPVWMKIVAAGLNRPPAGEGTTGATSNGTAEAGTSGTSDGGAEGTTDATAGGIGQGIANMFGGLPMRAGEGPIEEYGDAEANMQITALGCDVGYPAPEESNMVCMMKTTEADCSSCSVIGCMWTGTAEVGRCFGMPELALQKKNPEPVLENTQQEPQNSQSQGWPENVNPVYTLTFGVLAGAIFGCGLGMIYSRCTSKTNAFEEAMIHLDNAHV